jgi:hypothetical protein
MLSPTAIVPLYQTYNSGYPLGTYPLRTTSDTNSAWLIIGGNASSRIDLASGGIPVARNSTHRWQIGSNPPKETIVGREDLANVLCDPRMNLSSAMVTFSPESRSLSVSPKTLDTAVGNISPTSATHLLTRALLQPGSLPHRRSREPHSGSNLPAWKKGRIELE